MLDTHARPIVEPWLHATARYLLKRGITANGATHLALGFGLVSGACLLMDFHALALALLWTSGLLDAVDGRMARLTGTQHPYGAVLDVTYDRVTELVVIVALAWIFPNAQFWLLLVTASIVVAMTLFLTVGAVTPKQGEKSFYYQPGLGERTEALIMLSLMIVFPSLLTLWCLLFLAILWITIGQRAREARRILLEKPEPDTSIPVPLENDDSKLNLSGLSQR